MTRWIFLALALVGCRSRSSENADAAPAPSASAAIAVADGPTLVDQNCHACHSEEMLRQQRLTPAQWEKVVKKMAGWGATLEPNEVPVLTAHLAATYGPDAGPYDAPRVNADEALADLAPLDDGPFAGGDRARGAALFQSRCAACHGADARGQIGVNLLDRPLLARAADVARFVRKGRGKMPAQPSITDAEIGDMLAHLRSLRAAR